MEQDRMIGSHLPATNALQGFAVSAPRAQMESLRSARDPARRYGGSYRRRLSTELAIMLATLSGVVGPFAPAPALSEETQEPVAVLEQRASQTVASGDIEAHRLLLRETDTSVTDPVRLHLLSQLKGELDKMPKGSAREAIVAEVDNFSRDVYLDVTARSWRKEPQAYRAGITTAFVRNRIPGRALRLVDSPDAAQIVARLVVAEKKGRAYFKNFIGRDSEPAGFSTVIDASLAACRTFPVPGGTAAR